MACSKEEQKRREEVADPSQEGWAKYGPLTGTRGLTSGLTDRPASLPLLKLVLSGKVQSSPLGGSHSSSRDRAGTARAQPGRRVGEGGRRGRDAGSQGRRASSQRRAARGDFLQRPRPWALDRVPRGGRVPHPRYCPNVKPTTAATAHPQPYRPTAGHPPARSLPAFPSGVA